MSEKRDVHGVTSTKFSIIRCLLIFKSEVILIFLKHTFVKYGYKYSALTYVEFLAISDKPDNEAAKIKKGNSQTLTGPF